MEKAFARLLGILPEEVDLAAAIEDLYAEQVVGYYDGDTKELVVARGEELTALGRTIVVHELVHALADQHFDMSATLDRLLEEERWDEAAALQALAEGDATYFQMVYLQEIPPDEQVQAVLESLQADTTVLDSLPDWFGEDLAFPYEKGFGFVERLIAEGGAAAVDQAYTHLPTTVEQIMHPNAYFSLEPARPVALAATALEGYEVYEEGEFGEWNLMLYLLEGVRRRGGHHRRRRLGRRCLPHPLERDRHRLRLPLRGRHPARRRGTGRRPGRVAGGQHGRGACGDRRGGRHRRSSRMPTTSSSRSPGPRCWWSSPATRGWAGPWWARCNCRRRTEVPSPRAGSTWDPGSCQNDRRSVADGLG